ncbi:ribosomal L1 [Pyrrhoderma noxium]|uniref:Ribosomal protein n=1 Tax=Pyrrhoderma noxium TaxID=2282107 RepID=A0A286URN5_9AGAM|nr:ribosomal L1 [Pyrrhoderma noxium]
MSLASRLYSTPCYLTRSFSSSSPVAIRKVKARPVLTKAQQAAKERKKAQKARKNIYENEKMTLEDAIKVLRAVEVAKPESTYELIIKTAMGRGTTIPKGRINLPREAKPKNKDRVLVFAEGRQADEAKRAGAEFVGGTEMIEGVASGRYPATLILCTPALIRAITPKLGRILGPKGLMPSERRGTVTEDIVGYLKRISGSSEWKGDKAGTIRSAIAKIHFPPEDVIRNARHFLGVVKVATGNSSTVNERQSKGGPKPVNAITRVILSSTQGPGIQISDI